MTPHRGRDLAWPGVDAIRLSPIHPSPMADAGLRQSPTAPAR